MPKLTFQVIRRTIATLAKDKGHVKDIQGMMRHSRLATTTEIYMQSLESGCPVHRRFHSRGVARYWYTGAWPKAPANARVSVASNGTKTNAPNPPNIAVKGGIIKQPVRGVVLEFATKMRQSRGREVLLND